MADEGKAKRILTLASGRGSNFQAVVRALHSGVITGGDAVGLVTDRPDTGAEEFACEKDIPVSVVDFKSFADRGEFDQALLRAVNEYEPDLVLTLGFMRILGDVLVDTYAGRMINIHPSLLPAFPGIRSQKQALEYGVRITGATAHFVDRGVDTGPIILQAHVPVRSDHTLEELEIPDYSEVM